MSIPVSSGIGTGAAQIYDTSRSYNTMGKVLDASAGLMEYQQKMAALKKREEQEAKDRDYTKIAALQKLSEVDYGNMKPVYADLTLKESEEFRNKYAGRYKEILSGDPTVTNEFYKDLNILKSNVAKRVESWGQQKEIISRITKDPANYKNSQIALAEDLYLNPDVDISKYQSAFGQKLNIGNPFSDAAATYKNIFYKDKSSIKTDEGTYENIGDVFEDEKRSLAEWKNQLTANPELKVRMFTALEDFDDIEKDSRGVPTVAGQEQLIEKSYKLTKALLPESKEVVSTTKGPEESDGGKSSYKGISTEPFNLDGEKGFVINDPKGLKTIEISYRSADGKLVTATGIPSRIYRDAEGRMKVLFTKTSTSLDAEGNELLFRGETIKTVIDDGGAFAGKVKGVYGVDIFKTWKSYYGKKGSSDADVQKTAEELIKKYQPK